MRCRHRSAAVIVLLSANSAANAAVSKCHLTLTENYQYNIRMNDIMVRFIPLFLIIGLGALLRASGVLKRETVEGFKKIIITVALPSIFFLSFLTMQLQVSYIWLFISVFLFCLLLFGIGFALQKLQLITIPLLPFFFTGFEFGMVGVALFAGIFGADQLHHVLLIGLGHEIFIWFVYAPLLESQNHSRISIAGILKSFIRSPIILAIVSALLLNIAGVYQLIEDNMVTRGVHETLSLLSQLTTPLILMAIGYQLKLEKTGIGPALKIIAVRLLIVGVLGFGFYLFVDAWIMPVGRMMQYAFISFFLLPPPFIIPVFLGKKLEKESAFLSSTLVIYTLITLVLFLGIMLIMN